MKILRPFLLPVLSATTLLFLSGCSGNWLVGKWELDKDRTVQELGNVEEPSPNAAPGGGGLFKEIVGGLQKGLSRVLLTQFEGVKIEFTSDEQRKTKDGVGEALSYEILEKPDANTYLVKTDDGKIVTWEKVDSGIRLKLSEGNDWVYFRAVE
ncbi:MAG: hypothetical protein AAGF67_07410 [Verrucomicrobiota bacterium]